MLLLRIFSFSDLRKLYSPYLIIKAYIQLAVFSLRFLKNAFFLQHKTAAERNTPPASKQVLLLLSFF